MPTNAIRPDPGFNVDAVSLDLERGEGRPSDRDPSGGRWVAAGIALLFLLAAGAGYFLWSRVAPEPQPVASAPPAAAPAPQPMPEPAVKHPIDQVPGASTVDSAVLPPLPGLDDSDQVARDVIETTLNGDTYLRLLVPTTIIRHVVATIDNLPRKTIATRILPVRPVPGAFATTGGPGATTIAPDNAGRYAAYVKAAESIDTTRLAQFYVRLYPLFQQAYVDLGYPNGYFNDRVIDVIDHLLAAPELDAPAALVQPKVLFEFADPALESLSAGQKILVRIGTSNERRLKAKLRDIRKALSVTTAKSR